MNSGPTAERVHEALKRRIMGREFRSGDRLDPAVLAAPLSSTVTPARDEAPSADRRRAGRDARQRRLPHPRARRTGVKGSLRLVRRTARAGHPGMATPGRDRYASDRHGGSPNRRSRGSASSRDRRAVGKWRAWPRHRSTERTTACRPHRRTPRARQGRRGAGGDRIRCHQRGARHASPAQLILSSPPAACRRRHCPRRVPGRLKIDFNGGDWS